MSGERDQYPASVRERLGGMALGKKEDRSRSFSHSLQYAILRFFAWWVNILPLRLALYLGAFLGWTAWRVLGVRKEIALINLHQAFPEKEHSELERIGLASYENVGRFMMEFIRQKKVSESYIEKYISWTDPRQKEIISSTDAGVILLAFHFGSWELTGVSAKYAFGDVAFLVGEQRNKLVDSYINELRASQDIEIYTRDAALRGVISSLKRKGMVCWLSDQDAGRSGLVVDFFGYPASTPRGAAAFAVKLGSPIWCIFLEREDGPYQRFTGSELLYPSNDLGSEEAEIELTQRYTKVLEDMIIKRPDHYWWAHRRWKTTGLYRTTDREGQEKK